MRGTSVRSLGTLLFVSIGTAALLAGCFSSALAPIRASEPHPADARVSFNPSRLDRFHAPVSSVGYAALTHRLPPAPASGAGPAGPFADGAASAVSNVPVNAVRFVSDSSYVAQTETSVAVDPANTSHVVGGYNDFRGFFCPTTPFNLVACPSGATLSLSGFSTSATGGASLGKSGDLPGVLARIHDPYSGARYEATMVPFGDPAVAAAPGHAFYYASLAVGNNSSANGVELAVSNANLWGATACATALATPWYNPCWSARLVFANLSAEAGTFEDKDSIAVDRSPGSPYYGDAYVAWDHFRPDGTSQTYLARCTPTLSCTMLSGGDVPVISGPDQFVAWSTPIVGNGGAVHVSWCDLGNFTAFAPDFCRIASSSPGGTSFGANATVLSYGAPGTELPTATYVLAYASEQFRTGSIPSVAADTSALSGHLYFAIALCTQGHLYNFQQPRASLFGLGVCESSSVLLVKSADGGSTWSPPAALATSGVNTQPSVAVDPSSGALTVDWLTSRYDPENHRLDVQAAFSSDAGVSFAAKRITAVSDEPNDDPFWTWGFAPQIGDYQQAVDLHGRMWVLFTGNYVAEQGTFQADPFLVSVPD
jgi:hypothetical protein